jgi:hypothetical protein
VNLGIRDRALQGGHDGPIFEVGSSVHSRLIHLVAAVDSKSIMPPETGGLSKQEIGLLRAWIDQGAVWPNGTDVADPREEKAKTHWAFKRLQEVAVPAVNGTSWPQTPVDHFIRPAADSGRSRRFLYCGRERSNGCDH